MVNAGQVLTGVISPVVAPASPALPYTLMAFVSSGVKQSAYTSMAAPADETATLQKLSTQATVVKNALINQVTNPSQPLPPRLFDDRGQPLYQLFRVREFEVDSNFDHVADHIQLASGAPSATYNMDLDGDGIPNGYDRDLWPALYDLLSNVLINEVLMSNDFTNADEDDHSCDWVELYNPTNAAINIGDWYLSDSSGSNRTKWQIPTGTTIGSGQFLVIWASSKNRTNPALPLHTNFSLNGGRFSPAANPNPVFLSRYQGATLLTVDVFAVGATANYGPQSPDVSFGRYPTTTGLQTGYMVLPTPGTQVAAGKFSGAHNVVGALGFTNPPTFSGSAPGMYTDTSTPAGTGGTPLLPGDPGFPELVNPALPPTVTVTLTPPTGGGTIHFTTNGANPTRYSQLYPGPFGANRTLIVRAIAAKEGYLPSSSVTRSFIFKEDILGTSPQGTTPTDHQGARDSAGKFKGLLHGHPESTNESRFPLRYHMDSAIITAQRNNISTGLSATPIVSIVTPVPTFFGVGSGGGYANSENTETYGIWAEELPDPLNRRWQRLCSMEYLPNGTGGAGFQVNAGLSVTGGSSLSPWITRKHNLRVKFDATYGPEDLDYLLFPDNPSVHVFDSLHLKQPTQDSWAQNSNLWADMADEAFYCDEAWVRQAHLLMGHDGPRRRWIHLFINGIYWGLHELTERVDESFMQMHLGTSDAFDVLKQPTPLMPGNPEATIPEPVGGAGDLTAWNELLARCQIVRGSVLNGLPAATQLANYNLVLEYLDVDNYIDYLICNTFAGNITDWPTNNYRMARRRAAGAKFQFFVWDAEWAFVAEDQDANPFPEINVDKHVVAPHERLRSYIGYRKRFADRLRTHFYNGGALSITGVADKAVQLFEQEMAKVEPLLWGESARWGYLRADSNPAKTTPYQKSDLSYLPGDTSRGDWQRVTTHLTTQWIPQRRAHYLGHAAQQNLYVSITPATLPNGKVGTAYSQTLSATGGNAPRTFALAAGSLPFGLTLSGSTISGTPTTAGTLSFKITATSSDGIVGITELTLTIAP